MRPQYRSLAGVGVSEPILVDYQQQEFKIAIQVVLNGGVATYSAQSTLDDPHAEYPTSFNVDANWFDITDLAALTTDAQGNLFFPVRAVRLAVTSFTSGGPIDLTLLQASAPG